MSLLDTLLNKVLEFFQPVIGPLTKLWNILKGMVTAIIDVIPATIDLVKLVYSEVLAWKTFKEGINVKTGVVNFKSARERIEDLIGELIDAWHALVDLFTGGFKRVTLKPFEDAEAAAQELADLFGGFGKIGLKALQDLGPKLEKLGGKLFEILAIVQAVAEELLKVVNELTTIVNAIKDVRETFQEGEGLFLSQKNPRRTVALRDGGSIKIRVGNLHS